MKSFLESVTEELKRENPDIDFILDEATKEIADIPQTSPLPFPAPMVLIIQREPTEAIPAQYCIDYNTLLRYAQSSNQSVPAAYDQVVEKNCLSKRECALAIKDIDVERSKKEISAAPNDYVRENKLNGLLDFTNTIRELKNEGIDIVKY